MQSNNSIFASVWHQSIAVVAISLRSRNQGYKPCHLCLQMVNLQHHLNISLRAAFTWSLEVQAASKGIKQVLSKARSCLFLVKSRKINTKNTGKNAQVLVVLEGLQGSVSSPVIVAYKYNMQARIRVIMQGFH